MALSAVAQTAFETKWSLFYRSEVQKNGLLFADEIRFRRHKMLSGVFREQKQLFWTREKDGEPVTERLNRETLILEGSYDGKTFMTSTCDLYQNEEEYNNRMNGLLHEYQEAWDEGLKGNVL